jgi:hypothetical protein
MSNQDTHNSSNLRNKLKNQQISIMIGLGLRLNKITQRIISQHSKVKGIILKNIQLMKMLRRRKKSRFQTLPTQMVISIS